MFGEFVVEGCNGVEISAVNFPIDDCQPVGVQVRMTSNDDL
jgi:hypothetical protein